MKQFSSEPYFVVYNKEGICVRFSTQRGAMAHAHRLASSTNVIFIDHVGVMGVNTHHREEEGTNRRPWRAVKNRKVWVFDGLCNWEHQSTLR